MFKIEAVVLTEDGAVDCHLYHGARMIGGANDIATVYLGVAADPGQEIDYLNDAHMHSDPSLPVDVDTAGGERGVYVDFDGTNPPTKMIVYVTK